MEGKKLPDHVKRPDKAEAPEWDKVEEGEEYTGWLRHPETGEWVKRKVQVTAKWENPTLDGSEGARILSVQHKSLEDSH